MKLFDIVGSKVTIHAEALALPPFKRLWESDSDDKEKATNYISYIIFKNKWDSPYVLSIPPDEIEQSLKNKFFGDPNYELPTDVKLAEEEYKSINDTNILKMLNNMRLKLDSISEYYKNSLNEELDEKKIKDLFAGFEKAANTYKALEQLGDMVKAGEIKTSRIKGGAKMNIFELPHK